MVRMELLKYLKSHIKIAKKTIYIFSMLLVFNSYSYTFAQNDQNNSSGIFSLKCSRYEKQIEMSKSNREIFEQKLSDEKAKGESARPDVISVIESRVNEIDEQIANIQDTLDLCHGKLNPPNPNKCSGFEYQIEVYLANVKILEQKISDENAKENPKSEVITVAESKINDLKKQISDFQDVLNSCKEVNGSSK